MSRDILRVDGVTPEVKKALQNAALLKYGVDNASLLVRWLIDDYLLKGMDNNSPSVSAEDFNDRARVVIKLPKKVIMKLDEMAENRISDRNYFIVSLIMESVAKPQLLGDEIEVLRKSNYEISKIGTNLNQIARALNIIVKNQGSDKLPDIGRKIAAVRSEINSHTKRVLSVLELSTVIFDTKNRGRFVKKERKQGNKV